MNRVVRGALTVLLTAASLLGADAGTVAATGSFTHHALPAAADGSYPSRSYWLYTPTAPAPAGERPLVVVLHGCTESGDDVARGSDDHSSGIE